VIPFPQQTVWLQGPSGEPASGAGLGDAPAPDDG
jgi:hypothetical protein